jgi:hypothetical protein
MYYSFLSFFLPSFSSYIFPSQYSSTPPFSSYSVCNKRPCDQFERRESRVRLGKQSSAHVLSIPLRAPARAFTGRSPRHVSWGGGNRYIRMIPFLLLCIFIIFIYFYLLFASQILRRGTARFDQVLQFFFLLPPPQPHF